MGKRKTKDWSTITDEFNDRNEKRYTLAQLTEKYKRLRKRHCVIPTNSNPRNGMEYSHQYRHRECRSVVTSIGIKQECDEFRNKELNNYELLGQRFSPDAQTSSTQPDSAEGSHPKGKQLAHTDTSSGKKKKARSLDRVPESRKTVESAQDR